MEVRKIQVKLKTLNPHITCKLCGGYLIDATTVTECLHTFCKSCIVKFLEDNNTCPECKIVIHQSHPLNYISFDRTMQDIVYKLVPNLYQKELDREREFYKNRGVPNPRDLATAQVEKEPPPQSKAAAAVGNARAATGLGVNGSQNNSKENEISDYHRNDEQVNLQLDPSRDSNLDPIKWKYIRVSSNATTNHVRKYLAKKLWNNMDKYKDLEILCQETPIGKDHTLKFVVITHWRTQPPPLKLTYRMKMDTFQC